MNWEDYHFSIAETVSMKSTCPSRKVGCVIIDPESNFILATGYNGAPKGTEHCGEACKERESGKEYEKCKAVHAEVNAIVSAARSGQRLDGATMFMTVSPCIFCARVIIQAGIKQIFSMSHYSHPDAVKLLKEAKVKLTVKESGLRPGRKGKYDKFLSFARTFRIFSFGWLI
jgi:dCMP deaminase